MHDAVGEEEVLLDDAGGVDEERVGRRGDGQVAALAGAEDGRVGQVGGVADEAVRAVDDVVVEDVGELGGGHGF